MRRLRVAVRLLVGLLVAALATMLAGVPAGAHGDLREGAPGPGAETRPGSTVLRLEFERIDADLPVYVVVLDEQEEPVRVGDAVVVGDRTVCAATEELEPGVHTVQYQLTGSDGHGFEGRYSFEVVASGGTEVPGGACSTADLPAATEARTLADFGGASVPIWVWAGLGALLLGSATLAVRRLRAERAED